VVIWSCEWSFPSLTPEDRSSLTTYLDAGGSLYLSGQDIGWDLCDATSANMTPESVAWYNDYIHALYVADDSGIQSVEGVEADPVGNSLSFDIFQPGRDSENQYPSVVDPHGDGSYAVFRYTPTMDAAVRYRENYGVVYTAFGFEAVASGTNIDPVDHSGYRSELMRRILDYLGPIVHVPLMDTEDISAPITITASMTSPGTPDSLWVIYTKDPALGWTTALMYPQGGGTYELVVPAFGEPSDFYYYFETRSASFTWRYPIEDSFRIHVGPDTVLPQLGELSQLSPAILLDSPRAVQVRASDNLGLDLSSGLMHYMTEGDEGQSALTFQGWVGNEAILDGVVEPIGSVGDTVYYFAGIADTALAPNTGFSDTLFYVYGLEDFETGLENWDQDTDWIRQTGGNAHSGDWIARDSQGSTYPNNADNSFTLLNGVDLSSSPDARVSFWALNALEEDHDFCYLEASSDGIEWTTLVTLTGREMAWTRHEAPLDDFVGPGGESVLIRFHLVSDGETTLQGVYLDDVYIETEPSGNDENRQPLPQVPTLTIGPNPSSGGVSFHLTGFAGKPEIKVYDITGRLVRSLRSGDETRSLRWDGMDTQGKLVASGLYFARVSNSSLQGKVVLIK